VKGVEVETVEGMPLMRADRSDRYKVRLRIGNRLVSLYFSWEHLPELTKVDLTPDAPNPPWRMLPEEGFPDESGWDEQERGIDPYMDEKKP
jgi:hypothetical protein